jgi:hypothetical protein
VAGGADALRTVISNELIDSDTETDDTQHAGSYVYVESTGEQRRVKMTSGWIAATGALVLNADLAAVLPIGTVFWLVRRLGIVKYQTRTGLRDAINDALADLAVEHYLTLSTIASDGTIDVSAYSAWLTQERILGLRQVQIGSAQSYPTMLPGQPRLRRDSGSFILEPQVRVGTGDTVYLDTAIPSKRWIKVRRTARATATVALGAVTAVTVADGGAGYLSVPTVTLSGGGGTGATATATLSGNGVLSIAVTNGGATYTTAPTVTVGAPAGVYAESTVGLVNPDDECASELDTAVAVAKWHAFLGLARGPAQDTAIWEDKAARAEGDAKDLKWIEQPKREAAEDELLEDGQYLDERAYSWPQW